MNASQIVNDYEGRDLQSLGLLDQSQEREMETDEWHKFTTSVVALDIILIIYLAYFLRQIFVKFILKANLRIAPQDDENQNPYLYTFITGWPLVLIFIQSEGVYKSSMGTAAALGIDIMNIGLIFGILIHKFYKNTHVKMNYITGRDLVFYVMGYALVGTLYYLNQYYVLMCLVIFAYFLVYFIFQIFNKETKQLLMMLLDIQEEEYVENIQENFSYQKRRLSITNLVKFVKTDDPDFLKRFQQKQQFMKDKSPARLNMIRIVYTILNAIKNQQEYMIAYDARRYASRHPMAKVIQQLFEKENQEMDMILQEEEKEAQKNEEQQKEELHHQEEEELKKLEDHERALNDPEQYVMSYGVMDKVFHVVFFPVQMIVKVLPNFNMATDSKLFFVQYLLYLAIQLVINYIIVAFLHEICAQTSLSQETAGFVFLAFCLGNMQLNYDVVQAKQEKTIDYLSVYFQAGAFRIFCLGVGWCFKINSDYEGTDALKLPQSLGIVSFIWVCVVFVLGIMMFVLHQRRSKQYSSVYMLSYIAVFIASIIVMETIN